MTNLHLLKVSQDIPRESFLYILLKMNSDDNNEVVVTKDNVKNKYHMKFDKFKKLVSHIQNTGLLTFESTDTAIKIDLTPTAHGFEKKF